MSIGSWINNEEIVKKCVPKFAGMAKDKRYLFKADTLAELADKTGVDKKNFFETVENYNECCERGVDSEFFKSKDSLVPINKRSFLSRCTRSHGA
jgi:hypothetical protein